MRQESKFVRISCQPKPFSVELVDKGQNCQRINARPVGKIPLEQRRRVSICKGFNKIGLTSLKSLTKWNYPLFAALLNTVEIHRLDQWILDWTTAVAGKADTCQLLSKTHWSKLWISTVLDFRWQGKCYTIVENKHFISWRIINVILWKLVW